MAEIDWVNLFEKRNVEHVFSGPNVAKNHVAIKCPFCGDLDPSQHLGINLETGEWGCWRDVTHRGTKPHRLLYQLFRLSFEEVDSLLGNIGIKVSDFDERMRKLRGVGDDVVGDDARLEKIPLPKEFRKLIDSPPTRIFLNYIKERGFSDPAGVARFYRLYYSRAGNFRRRIIIPINYFGNLVSWTGRHIGSNEIRYKTLTMSGEDESKALMPSSGVVLEVSRIWEGGKTLIITEGPFDAIKLDWFLKEEKIRATCLFGKVISKNQSYHLSEILKGFKKVVILLDAGEVRSSFMVKSFLQASSSCRIRILDLGKSSILCSNARDPADLVEEDIRRLPQFF